MNEKLDDLIDAVLTVSPQLADAREAAALLESFGHTDASIRADYGFPNTFAVGDYILNSVRSFPEAQRPTPLHEENKPDVSNELKLASRKFSLSFAYALPWTALLVVEYLRPQAVQLSPEWGGVLSLSLIGSLIAAGGFTQIIARSGYFYVGLKEAALARRICMLFLKFGTIAIALLGLASLCLSYYFDLFAVSYLAAAGFNFLVLSLLWMFCSMLSIQGRGWRIPLVFLLGSLVFVVVRMVPRLGMIFPLFAASIAGAGFAALFAIQGFRKLAANTPDGMVCPELPRIPVLLQLLAPYFAYGTASFTFLFADRVAAGSAIPWASGLSFGLDADYKRGMDLALLIFLIQAAIVEYFAENFMRFWYRRAEEVTQSRLTDLNNSIQNRYRWVTLAIVVCFVLASSALWIVLLTFAAKFPVKTVETAVLGSLGYLFVSLALFNLIVLFSLNRPMPVLRAIVLAVFANFSTGYILSHLAGVQYAAVGLLLGGVVLYWTSRRVIVSTLEHSDYFYALA